MRAEEDRDAGDPARQWRMDPAAFIAAGCRVRHPVHGAVDFALWPWQRELLGIFARARRVVILKSRQVGCSELVAAYALWRVRVHPGELVLLLSRRQQDASDLLERVGFMLDHLPPGLAVAASARVRDAGDMCWVARRNTRTLELAHLTEDGIVPARVDSLPATRGTGRGKPASLVILDEWAHQPWQEEIWAAIAPTISAGGNLIGLSTANGLGNRFHQIWVGAEAGTNGFTPIFVPWMAQPERDAEWYAEQARALEPWQLHQEYPAIPGEAFIQSGRPIFEQRTLDRHEQRLRAAPAPLELADGLAIWEAWRPEARYVIGADVAEGLAAGDFDAAIVVRAGIAGAVQVAALRGRWPPDEYARRLDDLGRRFGAPLLAVERNNHGHACLLRLRDLGYPRLYHHIDPLVLAGQEDARPGWPTNRATKPLIIDALAAALREDLFLPRDPVLMHEARAFSYRANGSLGAPPGFHDDTVIAAAIAVYLASQPEAVAATVRVFQDLAEQARRGARHAPQAPPPTGADA